MSPNKFDIMSRSQKEIDTWFEIGKMFLEVPELLSYSEHAMFIGEKL